jgi:hypothetical protein
VAVQCAPVCFRRLIAELVEQLLKFLSATVHIANDVEGSVVATLVTPQRLALDRCRCDLILGSQDMDGPEPLALQAA